MMDYNLFLEKYYPNANEQKTDDVIRFFSYLDDLLEGASVETALLDSKFLCRTFYLQSTSGISRPHYQKIKDYLLNLFDYYQLESVVPSREDVIAAQTIICYFKDLDDILSFIDRVGNLILSDYDAQVDLVNLKSVVVLGWYGLTPNEIAALPRFCIHADDGFYVTKPNGDKIAICETAFKILDLLHFIDSYKGLPSGKKVIFKSNNGKLFRTTSVSCEELSETHIIQIIGRFNKVIPPSISRAINFRKLRKNALFVEIFEDKTDKSIIEKIMIHANCTNHMAYGYKLEYERWCNFFYS